MMNLTTDRSDGERDARELKPLCEKDSIQKTVEAVLTLIGIVLDVILIINARDHSFLYVILPFSLLLAFEAVNVIYWLHQPKVLIYQYDTGIVINGNIEIEYRDIDKVYYKNRMFKRRLGPIEKDPYVGSVTVELKSGKKYIIRNVFYPIGVADTLTKIKQQRKFR